MMLLILGPHGEVLDHCHQVTFLEKSTLSSPNSHLNVQMARDVTPRLWPANHLPTNTCFWCGHVWLAVPAECFRANRVMEY